jgi:hypothetical protein
LQREQQQAIRDLAGAMRDLTGNLPMLPGDFPDYSAPIVRRRRMASASSPRRAAACRRRCLPSRGLTKSRNASRADGGSFDPGG